MRTLMQELFQNRYYPEKSDSFSSKFKKANMKMNQPDADDTQDERGKKHLEKMKVVSAMTGHQHTKVVR